MNLVDEIKISLRKGNILYRLDLHQCCRICNTRHLVCYSQVIYPGRFTPGASGSIQRQGLKYLMVPSLPGELLYRPWTVITYMFTHFNIWHILFNMLMLYWFGRIFMQYLTARQLVKHLFAGGIGRRGTLHCIYQRFPGFKGIPGGSMLGASASIMAIVVAISFYVPNYTIYLVLSWPR